MAATPININFNSGTGWSANPATATVPKSQGVRFNVTGNANGCRLCLNNSNVFGSTTLDLPSGIRNQPVTGSPGQSSTYNVQNPGVTCPSRLPGDGDPFDITIGSGVEKSDY